MNGRPAAAALLLLAGGCKGDPERTGPDSAEAPWSKALPDAGATWSPMEGLSPRRAVIHLHSPWSHDACDGAGLDPPGDPAGTPDPSCLDDLREGLCTARYDVAFLTDHPSYAAFQEWDRLLLDQPGDEPVFEAGEQVGFRIACEDGHRVLWLPGYEDQLMPVGFRRQVPGTAEERDDLLNRDDAQASQAMRDAGATVLLAHTEGRDLATLTRLQDEGLAGVEIFNLHAMFAPDIREEDLGLSPFGWTAGLEAFTTEEGGAEPDLLFLAVLQAQPPSLAHWDALLARGPMLGIGGADAHQNVLNYDLPDGERGDSYRRTLRWFSNLLWTEGDGPADYQAAIEAGRNTVVFEALGTPVGFDLWFDEGSRRHPVGSEVQGPGTLVVGCPELAPGVPRGPDDPEIAVRVLRDGAPWATGCGEHAVTEPGVYRVEVDQVPHHLRPFLGPDPDPWIHDYPWIYTNAIRVL